MSGTVGESNINIDHQQDVVDGTPYGQSFSLNEKGQPVRNDRVTEPPDRARTTQIKTISEFYALFLNTLEAAKEVDGTKYPVRLVKEFPPIPEKLPCFVVKLISRRPWSPNGRTQYGDRYMQEIQDPDFVGQSLIEQVRLQENVVQVSVLAKTSKVADEMAQWVEDKFFEYLWALQWGGPGHPVLWLGRGEDKYIEKREQQVYEAPLTFKVVTQQVTRQRVSQIRKVAIQAGILESSTTFIP